MTGENAIMQGSGFDITIIGGGVIGLSLARALRAQRMSVCVIDAKMAMPQATSAAAGMLAPAFEEGPPALEALTLESHRQWPDFAAALEEETGVDIDFQCDGVLGVATSQEEAKNLAQHAEVLRAAGRPAQWLDENAVRAMEPTLASYITAGVMVADEGQVDARKLRLALATSCANTGVESINATARKIRGTVGAREVVLSNGNCVAAGAVVFASGAAAVVPVDGLTAPPVIPVKGEALALQRIGEGPRRVIRAANVYMCPKSDGRLIVGATEKHGDASQTVNADEIDALRTAAQSMLPALGAAKEIERWAGIRPGTPDNAPILGASEYGPPDIFMALGAFRNGVLIAPACAQLLVPTILGGNEAVTQMKAFSPDRFSA